jgi:HEAT repeat protein
LEGIKENLEKRNETLLPGFNLPKGIDPILPMFLNGLMFGSAELREQSASGLGDLINLTSEEALKPFVIQITGPLIRVIGDRFNWEVKAAILQTLNLMIAKGGIMLKPFLPQLQSTFIKALSDTNRNVRIHAATALGGLMTMSTRIDPLVTELLAGVSNTEGGVQEAMLTALQQVLLKAGKTVSPELLAKVGSNLVALLTHDEENIRIFSAKTLGVYSKFVGEAALNTLMDHILSPDPSRSWQARHGASLALTSVIHHNSTLFSNPKYHKLILSLVLKYLNDEKVPVRQSSCETIGQIVVDPEVANSPLLEQLLAPMSDLLSDETSDVKITVLKVIKKVAKLYPHVS